MISQKPIIRKPGSTNPSGSQLALSLSRPVQDSSQKLHLAENDEETLSRKIPIAKLNLEKISHKISCEKSSTKPETSLESLFEDIIAYFNIDETKEKEFSFSSEKYEQAVNYLKSKEDERRVLVNKQEKLQMKMERVKDDLAGEEQIKENLLASLAEVKDEIKRQEFVIQKILGVKVHAGVQTESEEGRFEDSSFVSGLSSFSETPDLGGNSEYSKRLNESEFLVHSGIKLYIEKLLAKISVLIKKKKALRKENHRLALILSRP